MLLDLIKCPDLRNRFAVLVSRVREEYLRFWQAHIPHYTDHGESHCETVENNLDQLIPERIKRDFNEYEVFILLCSVWLHDVGLTVRKSDEEIKDVREAHHLRCIKIIMEEFNEILPNDAERAAIGTICRAHRDIELSTLNEHVFIAHHDLGNQKIRVRFLAALLRLADSCDTCAIRAKANVETWPEDARFYHLLHRRVCGIDFKPDVATIEITMFDQDQDEFNRMIMAEFVTNKLRLELRSVQETLSHNGIHYFIVKENFIVLQEQLPHIEVPQKILDELKRRLTGEILSALGGREPGSAFRTCKKLNLIDEKIPLEIAIEIARTFGEEKNFQSAIDVLKFCLQLEPDNKHLLTHLGLLQHDYLFDWKESYNSLKKVFDADTKSEIAALNYAETCVTFKKYADAYPLATHVSETTSNLNYLLNARLVQIWSLYFLGKEEEGLKMIQALVSIITTESRKYNSWTYTAMIKFIKESELQSSVKNMLLDLIDVVNEDGKKSVQEFKSTYFKQ